MIQNPFLLPSFVILGHDRMVGNIEIQRVDSNIQDTISGHKTLAQLSCLACSYTFASLDRTHQIA